MTAQLRKAWADVVSGGGRSLLVVLALILGVAGLGTMVVSARILGPDLRENFLGTLPPHAIVQVAEPGSLDPGALGPRVAAAEYRDLKLLRVEIKPQEWVPLWLFGVRSFERQNLALVVAEPGFRGPVPGSMVIERNGLLVSDLQPGGSARIRSGGKNLSLPISGVAFDPAQAPATQDRFLYGYTDQTTWQSVTGLPSGSRLLLRFTGVGSKADVVRAVAELRLPAENTVSIPEFEEHPHQWQLDLLLGIVGSVGFLAFFLSTIIVGQVVSALLARQVRQIGILKALGASGRRVAGLYGLSVLGLALAAGLVSVPLAAAAGQAFARYVAQVLNFNILTASLPGETLGLLVITALALPFAFAAPTVLRASRMPIRAALADAAVVPPAQGLRRGSWALRNLLRRPGRTLLGIITIALGVAIFSTGFNIRESLAQFLGVTRDAMRFDLQVVLSAPVPRSDLEDLVAPLTGVSRTELWTGGRGELQSRAASLDSGVGIVALPYDTPMAAPRILEGRWLTSASAPEVVLNQEAVVALGQPRVGQSLTLTVNGAVRSFRVVGLVEEIDKAKVYLSDALWKDWVDPENRANTLTLLARDRDYESVLALKRQVEEAVAQSPLPVLYVMSQAERTKIIADHLDIILSVLLLLAFLVLWVAALGTAASSSITVLERTREIGVLRALGAGPRRIVRMFVAEGMLTAAAGLGLGLLVSVPLSLVASSFFGTLMLGEGASLRFAWNPWGTGITVAVTLAFGWLANRSPAAGATRVSTRKALAYE